MAPTDQQPAFANRWHTTGVGAAVGPAGAGPQGESAVAYHLWRASVTGDRRRPTFPAEVAVGLRENGRGGAGRR